MEFLELAKSRRSIRKYTERQISREDMEKIIEAGAYAPNAGGGQRSMIVGVRSAILARKLGVMNLARFDRSNLAGSYVSRDQPSVIDDPSMKSGFYGAPSVVAIFCQANFLFATADAFCCAENMILQAKELGISSCIISRGEETFLSEEGQRLLREWHVPENYVCKAFVILGYIAGDEPPAKPRREGRTLIVE